MPKATLRRGRTIKPSAELAQEEMSWGGEGEGRRGARTSRTGLGLSARGAVGGGRKTAKKTRSRLSRQPQATAPLRRGKKSRATAKKSVVGKSAQGRARGRATGARKSSRTRRSRAS